MIINISKNGLALIKLSDGNYRHVKLELEHRRRI